MDNSMPGALARLVNDKRELAERNGWSLVAGGRPASPGSARGAAARVSLGAGTAPAACRGGSDCLA